MTELFTAAAQENLIKQKKLYLFIYILTGAFTAVICGLSIVFWRNLGETIALIISTAAFGGYGCYSLVFWQMNAYRKKKLNLFLSNEIESLTATVKKVELEVTTIEGLQFFTVTAQTDREDKVFYLLNDFAPPFTEGTVYELSISNKIIYAYRPLNEEEENGVC